MSDHRNICNDDTSLILLGLKIQEPVTVLTDLFITFCCWYVFFRSGKEVQKNFVTELYRVFFFIMGLSTFFGGIFGHAFCYALDIGFKLPGWILSMIAVMLAERSAIMHTRKVMPQRVGKFFINANIIELIIMITVTCLTLNFFFVELHAFYGFLIVVASFELYNYYKTKNNAAKWILYSVVASSLAAVVHIGKLSPHRWFNYLDLAHCIMCASIFLLYQGVKRIKIE